MKALGLLIAILLASTLPAHGAVAAKISRPEMVEVLQGEVVEVKVSGDDLVAVEGRMGNEKIYFYPNSTGGFSAIVGADVEAKAGPVKILLKLISRAGTYSQREVPFKIKAKAFRRESFSVPPGFDQMSPEAREEFAGSGSLFRASSRRRRLSVLCERLSFAPCPHELGILLRSRPLINGTPRAPHSAPICRRRQNRSGRPSWPRRPGGEFFLRRRQRGVGSWRRLFTMYSIYPSLRSKKARWSKSDVLALSGATGRWTGAHLHGARRLATPGSSAGVALQVPAARKIVEK